MIRLDVHRSLVYDQKKVRKQFLLSKISEAMRAGVTVRSKLDERDLALADDIFLCTEPLCSSIRYLPIFFLVGQPPSVKNPLWPPLLRFLPRKRFITIYNSLVDTPLFPSPFHVVRLSISLRLPDDWRPESATLPHLSPRGFPPDDDPGPQAENSSTSIFRNI